MDPNGDFGMVIARIGRVVFFFGGKPGRFSSSLEALRRPILIMTINFQGRHIGHIFFLSNFFPKFRDMARKCNEKVRGGSGEVIA